MPRKQPTAEIAASFRSKVYSFGGCFADADAVASVLVTGGDSDGDEVAVALVA